MTDEADFERVAGTGNIFKELGDPDAEIKQTKVVLAADITLFCHGTRAPPRASRLAEIAWNGNLVPDWTIYRWV